MAQTITESEFEFLNRNEEHNAVRYGSPPENESQPSPEPSPSREYYLVPYSPSSPETDTPETETPALEPSDSPHIAHLRGGSDYPILFLSASMNKMCFPMDINQPGEVSSELNA